MILKRLLQLGLLLSAGLTLPAWAILIDDSSAGSLDGTHVGSLDIFIDEGPKQGNPTSEQTWVNSILAGYNGDSTTYSVKTENVSYFMTDLTDVYAFQLAAAPKYFLIKNATRIALFENLPSLDWGVFDAGDLSGDINLPTDGFTISHVTEFGAGGDVPVPEPGILGLLGLGLLGIGLRRRLSKG